MPNSSTPSLGVMGKIPKINGFLYKNIAGQTLKFSATHLVTPVESSPLLLVLLSRLMLRLTMLSFRSSLEGGVKIGQDVRTQLRGVSPVSTNKNKGRVGVKKPEIFAYVLYGWPLMYINN